MVSLTRMLLKYNTNDVDDDIIDHNREIENLNDVFTGAIGGSCWRMNKSSLCQKLV